ncbi:MAG: hypothetical protein E7330_01215 [Clostridiales bacterium]|nr:hypothetical protein [Clostridiales bacterium]
MNKSVRKPLKEAFEERMALEGAVKKVREEYENSPEYRIGCELIDGLTEELGISAEQAAEMLSAKVRPSGVDVLSSRAAATLGEMEKQGALKRPAKAYLEEAAFEALLKELPAAAAIRVFDAENALQQAGAQANSEREQEIYEMIRAQRALPRQMKPQAPTAQSPDFGRMSSEEFELFKKHYFSR